MIDVRVGWNRNIGYLKENNAVLAKDSISDYEDTVDDDGWMTIK